eukprot:9323644-Pyramimonas_sp.AAC.1
MSGAATRAPNVYRAPAAKCRSVRVSFSRSIGCPRCPSPRPRPLGRFPPTSDIPRLSETSP